MFALLVCILMLHRVHAACNGTQDICTEHAAVQAQIVDQHNAYRRAVRPTAANMLLMSWSDELAASVQTWVNNCILAHGPPSTRTLNGYRLGENLFYSSSPIPWKDIMAAWHSEVANYQYPSGSANNRTIGHYTQVVWNSSYKLGCGVKLCPNSIYLYGCHYYRAGNIRTWPPYKAGPWCAYCPNDCDNKLCTNPCPFIDKYINCPILKVTTGCGNALVYAWCPASCKCVDKIIPIA